MENDTDYVCVFVLDFESHNSDDPSKSLTTTVFVKDANDDDVHSEILFLVLDDKKK